MAKLRDELIRAATHREAGARDMRSRHLKEINVRMGRMREVKNDQGQVYKLVSTLECRAEVTGVPAFEYISEMEAKETYGVLGEVDVCLSPALQEFLEAIKKAVTTDLKAQSKPLDPEAYKSFSDRPKNLAKIEQGRAVRAREQKAKEDALRAEAEADPGAGEETEMPLLDGKEVA